MGGWGNELSITERLTDFVEVNNFDRRLIMVVNNEISKSNLVIRDKTNDV
jgi:hypothetical protein